MTRNIDFESYSNFQQYLENKVNSGTICSIRRHNENLGDRRQRTEGRSLLLVIGYWFVSQPIQLNQLNQLNQLINYLNDPNEPITIG